MKRNRRGRIIPDATPDEQVYWTDAGGFTGHADEGLPPPVRRPPHNKGTGKRRPTMFKHFKVTDLLRDEHREAYLALVLRPGTTIAQLHRWLTDRGYRLHTKSVARHRNHYFAQEKGALDAAERTRAVIDLLRQQGPATLTDAAAARAEQLMLEKLMQLDPADAGSLTPQDLAAFGKALEGFVAARQQIERMRADYEAKAKRAALEAARLADGLTDGQRVAARVAEILGV